MSARRREAWAQQVFGEPDVEKLWEKVAFCMRLDEPDPVAAWREHIARLRERAAALDALKPDAIHYRGPGTDLTVGLHPNARWYAGSGFTKAGIEYVANMPTEEIFTSPDCRRAEGTIRSTCRSRSWARWSAVWNSPSKTGASSTSRPRPERTSSVASSRQLENADRLGELALVTGDSRVGQSGTLFYDTLFDENATCHIAYGFGFPFVFDGDPPAEGLNVAQTHVDFMVGGPELEIDALLADGTAVPVIRDEAWQLA